MRYASEVLLMLVIAGLFLLLGTLMGLDHGVKATRREAIAAGVAEWIADKNGDPEFKWKITSSAPSLKSSEEGK